MESDEIKYIVTWTINKNHDSKHAYVQVNAFNEYQENLDYSDADWPALGFLVPKHICEVLNGHPFPIPQNPFDLDGHFAPSLPPLHSPAIPPTIPSIIHRPHRRAHVWEHPMSGLKRFATLDILTSCRKPSVEDEAMELE
jgi:hypothetical protein